ncbi:MAG: DUF6263 family protein [Bacteroidota bacterium]
MQKNILLLSVSFLLTILVCNSQEQIHFKIGYLPNKIYNITISSSQVSNMRYLGPDSLLADMKAKGDSLTKKTTQQSYYDASMETFEKAKEKQEFGIEMSINKMKIGLDSNLLPDGIKFLGKISGNSAPRFDSVVADGFDAATKRQLMQMIQKMLSQVTFPEKDVKKGESFTHELPIQLPVSGKFIKFKIVTKYTLMNINKGMAIFAVNQTYTMDSPDLNNSFSVTGDGDGELLYDIQNNYYKKYQINLSLNTHTKTDKAEMVISAKSYFEETAAIVTK